MSNLLLQKIVLLRVTEVGKIILKKKRPLLLARSVDKVFELTKDTPYLWRKYFGENDRVITASHCILTSLLRLVW